MPAKILIIESKENAQKILKDKLIASLFDVHVGSGVQSIQQAVHLKPDLIVLDMEQGGDVGLLILERLRLLAETRAIPIVVLMGTDPEGDREKILKFQIEGYLERLYTPNGIIAEINRILKGKRTSKKIIVVDDDPVLVKMLTSRISANGYESIGITDSTEAIKRIHTENPDLIITDIVMPNVSGWKITEELKGKKEYKDLPIIFLSGLITEDSLAEKHEIVDYFMSKPPAMQKLLDKIKELLTKTN